MTPEDQAKYNERLTRLSEVYAPQIQGLQEQISTLPQMYEAQKSALQQAKENAFRDITKTAARGGMYFTGFTPREQARYLGERFLPGMQQLTQQELSARQGLLGQIATLQGQQRAAGLSYLDQLEAWRRADEQARLAREAAASRVSAGGGGGFDFSGLAAALGAGANATPTAPTRNYLPSIDKTNEGFQFTDAYGKPITAAQYVNLQNFAGNKITFRDLLQQMANSGDKNAQVALKYVGNDFKFGSAPESARGALSALGATGNYQKPKQSVQNVPTAISPQLTQSILGTRSIY